MKAFRLNFPIILLAIFEAAVGVLLLWKPDEFWKYSVIVFGAALILVGIVGLIRFLAAKKKSAAAVSEQQAETAPKQKEKTKEKGDAGIMTMIGAAAALIVGIVFVSLFWLIVPKIVSSVIAIAVIFGVVVIVSALYKAELLAEMKKEKLKISIVAVITIILSIAFGAALIVLTILKKNDLNVSLICLIISIGLFVLAAFDIISLFHAIYLSGDEKRTEKKLLEKQRQEQLETERAEKEKAEKEKAEKERLEKEKAGVPQNGQTGAKDPEKEIKKDPQNGEKAHTEGKPAAKDGKPGGK